MMMNNEEWEEFCNTKVKDAYDTFIKAYKDLDNLYKKEDVEVLTDMQEMEKEHYNEQFRQLIQSLYDSNISIPKDTDNLLNLCPDLITLCNMKGKGYGRAYAKYGDFSIFFNLDRKYERITNIMKKRMEGKKDDSDLPTETIFDTVADLAIYAMLWLGYMKENNPNGYNEWRERNIGK